jgi:modulator of FtsH protease HflC
MSRFFRNPIVWVIGVILLLILVGSTVVIVPETKQAVVTRFGQPLRVINRYEAGQQFGDYGAGIAFRVPFMDSIEWVDKRIQSVGIDDQQVLSTDQLRLQVDAFARFRIVDPLRMYISARTEDRVGEALRPILASSLRNELGRRPFAALLSPERGQMMENIQQALNRVAAQYGAEIVDVRIKRADLPTGTPLDSAYNRMRTARQQEARSIQAQGLKQAQIIRAEAEAEASATYARAYNQDPEFYDFYRAMQSYRTTFLANQGGGTNVILSPENDYLRQFRGGRPK